MCREHLLQILPEKHFPLGPLGSTRHRHATLVLGHEGALDARHPAGQRPYHLYTDPDPRDIQTLLQSARSQVRDLELLDATHLGHGGFEGERIVGIEALEDVETTVEQDVPPVIDAQVTRMYAALVIVP